MSSNSKTIAIIIPSRSRPHNIKRLHEQWYQVTNPKVQIDVYIVLDIDDNTQYERLSGFIYSFVDTDGVRGVVVPLNKIAIEIAPKYDYIGFMGDDHLPVTQDWNVKMMDVLLKNGDYAMVYGNDLFQKGSLCTQIIMDSKYIIKLGYFTHPSFNHLFFNTLWLHIGRKKNNIHYLDDVIIEHLHFVNNKAEKDELYKTNYSRHEMQKGSRIYKRLIKSPDFINSLLTLK